MAALQAFHLAIPVHDLDAARGFYSALGWEEKRSGRRWIEYDLMGHQIVAHLVPDSKREIILPITDMRHVPVPHFGVVLTIPQWRQLVARVREAGLHFALEPMIEAEGEADEHATLFLCDPSGNTFEFKAFANPEQLFG